MGTGRQLRAVVRGVLARSALRARRASPMTRQALLLLLSLAGVVLGAALIARWAVGLAVIADSVFGVWLALNRDVPVQPQVDGVPTHDQVIARFRAAP